MILNRIDSVRLKLTYRVVFYICYTKNNLNLSHAAPMMTALTNDNRHLPKKKNDAQKVEWPSRSRLFSTN